MSVSSPNGHRPSALSGAVFTPRVFGRCRLRFQVRTNNYAPLEIECYPCRRVVASVRLSSHPSVYTAVYKMFRGFRREQKVIKSHALILRPTVKFVIPECPEWSVRMQLPQSVGPSLIEQTRESFTALGLNER